MAKEKGELARDGNPRVQIQTPAAKSYYSRGFYQIEEDILYVPIVPGERFFSYLDSAEILLPDKKSAMFSAENEPPPIGRISLDIDRSGHLLFLCILTPQKHWRRTRTLLPPSPLESADVRFIDFRQTVSTAEIETNDDGSLLRVSLSGEQKNTPYQIAENLIFEISSDSRLAAIWILQVTSDRAARGMAEWRREISDRVKSQNRDERRIQIKE